MPPSWLTAYPSLTSPYILAPVLAAIAVLAFAFTRKPHLFIPAMMWACPMPKLFSVGVSDENFETIAGGTLVTTSRPGGSLGEIVLFAGIIALAIRLLEGRRWRSGALTKPLGIWMAVMLVSSAASLLFADYYRAAHVLHTIRFCATILCYFIARHLTSSADLSILWTRARKWLFASGNTYVLLAFVYYILWGSNKSAFVDQAVSISGGIWRNYLFFFDYAYDYGMFAACICALDLAVYRSSRSRVERSIALAGGGLSVITVIFTGERGCLLILAATLFGLGWMVVTRRSALRFSAGFVVAAVAVLAVAVAYSMVFPPEGMAAKLSGTTADIGEAAGELAVQAGVDPSIAYWIARLNMGDFAYRVALMAGSLTYFLAHPLGAGFGAELAAAGWFAHHDLCRLAVEQGIPGILAFSFVIAAIRRFAFGRVRCDSGEPAADVTRSVAVAAVIGMFVPMLFAVMTVFSIKFGLLFWTMLGIVDGPPASPKPARRPHLLSAPALVQGTRAC